MNKEELLKEFNAKVEDLRQELLEKLKLIDEKKSFEVDLPGNGKKFHFIDNVSCDVDYLYYREKLASHEMRWKNGMLFESAKEAEHHLKESELLFRIKKWAEIYNEGWKPDWNNLDELRYTLFYSDETNELLIACSRTNRDFSILPAFKSSKIARECIKEFEEEIKEVLL